MTNYIYSEAATGKSWPLSEIRWHGSLENPLDLMGQADLDLNEITKGPLNLWRYFSALPLDGEGFVSLGETMTPVIDLPLQSHQLKVKLDYYFPTGSYKDRGAAVLMSLARQMGVKEVIQDSSGNAGCAIAAYAAAAGIACQIFVPASTSSAKLAQIRAYGARLNLIPGSREDTAEAALQAAKGKFYASHVWHPVFLHGVKTFAFEFCEQLDWQVPDTLILPAGNGTLLLGAETGFRELKESGITDSIPKLVAIQAANCSPLTQAWEAQRPPQSVPTFPTLAEGIAIADPRRGQQIIAAVNKTQGLFLSVTEEEIEATTLWLAQKGLYVEPTSAAILAGARNYVANHAQKDEKIASVLTGNGLKSTEKFLKILGRHQKA